jgi:predicted hydrocarbon binding protein
VSAAVEVLPISWQVIDLLVEKIVSLIGKDAAGVLGTVRAMDHSQDPSPEMVYQLGNDLGELLGKDGAFAIVRQVGREIGKEFTDGKSRAEALKILEETLRHLGFAYRIDLDDDDAYICQCVFYDLLDRDGFGPIERPVCWAGWGFIEGSLANISGAHHITWAERDYEAKRCRFRIKRSALE